MMKNSPYLDQDRELDVLLRLVRDYDSDTRQFTRLPDIARATAMLSSKPAARVGAKTVMVSDAARGKSSLKRAS